MANTFVQNYMHITFHVKEDRCIDTNDIPRLCDYIGGIAKNLGGVLLAGGGTYDHIHLLVSVPKNISLSDYMMKIKANSSRWLKTVGSQYRAFSWQDGYGAFSVSASRINAVKGYIANQGEHHRKKTYAEELEELDKAYNTIANVPPFQGSNQITV